MLSLFESIDSQSAPPPAAEAISLAEFGENVRKAALFLTFGAAALGMGCAESGGAFSLQESNSEPTVLRSSSALSLSNQVPLLVEGMFQFEGTSDVYGAYVDVSGKSPKVKYGKQPLHSYSVVLPDNSRLSLFSDTLLPVENNPLKVTGYVCRLKNSSPELGLCEVKLYPAE